MSQKTDKEGFCLDALGEGVVGGAAHGVAARAALPAQLRHARLLPHKRPTLAQLACERGLLSCEWESIFRTKSTAAVRPHYYFLRAFCARRLHFVIRQPTACCIGTGGGSKLAPASASSGSCGGVPGTGGDAACCLRRRTRLLGTRSPSAAWIGAELQGSTAATSLRFRHTSASAASAAHSARAGHNIVVCG